ncbi:BRCA1-associated RING domain protein 1-like [Nymphalis io]|uniref:BRCA1-associated RING domain protein 1-like n=1 Tax=Inachis io TaxID=171585 RepID=UPI0021678986|nr:BRCA1-associated RING domain protein 1-like [Nymphalis io]
MSTEKLNKFLKALDAVRLDYTCGYCSELCKDPVTLSTCYHLICSEHFKNIRNCPTCNIPLTGCTAFADDSLKACINSTKELSNIFESFRNKNVLQNTKGESSNGTSKKRALNEKAHSIEISDKENKKTGKSNTNMTASEKSKKPENKIENLSSTLLSSASSRMYKGIEKRNNKGETALHVACRLGKVDTVIELLKQGANTNTKDNAGWTPLHEVVQNGRLDLVKILLQYNTLIDVPGQGNETPLHEAVRYNHTEIAKELVKNGANIKSRNSKGETPIELASDDMKKALEDALDNIIQTQGVNVTIISELHAELDFEDIRVFCVSQFRTVHNKLKILTKHHSNIHIEAKFVKKVTHLIVDTEDDHICTSSLDILQGIVSGIWIISSQWITKSTETNLEPFNDYEVKGVGNSSYLGPKNSRYNKYKQLPGIFNGCHFYLHNFNTKYEISKTIVLTKAILTKLIIDAGGVVLRRVPNPELIPDAEKLVPYHAKKDGKLVNCSHYIIFKDIYEPMYNMAHFKALPIGWLIECIEKYELCEPW